MKILVTGRSGQVARSLSERLGGHQLIFAERPDFDLNDFASIERTVARTNPDVVISAAAYTQVEQAERDRATAMRVNGEAPGVLARAAARTGARVIHLSTDYVFDGSSDRPWREADGFGPLNVYGESKLAGEVAVTEAGAPYAILRTAWVYSPFGSNFVRTMLRLAAARPVVHVVADQRGSPTSALDLADAIGAMLETWRREPERGIDGAYHAAGPDAVSWADFAEMIFRESRKRGGPAADVTRVAAADYPSSVARPLSSVLDGAKFATTFGFQMRPMAASLAAVVKRILADYA